MSALGRFAVSARTRVLFTNIGAGFVGRVINMGSMLIAIPLAVHALGVEHYGILAVVLSLTTFFAFADFGLGLAIVNDVAQAEAKADLPAARRAISQVWFFLWVSAALVMVAGILVAATGLLPRILPTVPEPELEPVWAVLVASSALGIPLAVAQRVYFALQLGSAMQAWATAGRMAVVLGAFAANIWAPRLVVFVGVFAALPVAVAALYAQHLFGLVRPDLRPSLSAFAPAGLWRRVSVGLQFSLLHVSNFIEIGIDPLLLGYFFPPSTIAQFDLLSRVFGYIPALASIVVAPLWPALRGAIETNDRPWFDKMRQRARLGVFAVSTSVALVAIFASNQIIVLWTGVSVNIQGALALKIAMAFWVVVNTAAFVQSVVLNATGKIGSQALLALLVVVIILPLKLYLFSQGNLSAAVFSMVAIYLLKIVYLEYLVNKELGRDIRGGL